MVSNGSWKDYALTFRNKRSQLLMYIKDASEKPFLRILKNLKPKYYNEKYLN